MKLDIARLADGKEVIFRESWDPIDYDLNVPGREHKSSLDVEAIVQRDSGIIKVKVLLRSLLCLTCSRCFKDFEQGLDKVLNFIYSVDLSEKKIELDDDIRGELILDYPQKILCKEDCKGMCPYCGADLNIEKCKCSYSV
ncbi:MAG TPA: hypothetical protein DCL35_03490 [Candidatus Omnitrophica bacterium]|nr:hypothetical protein [Candidatus Omnitrophota bacterium]